MSHLIWIYTVCQIQKPLFFFGALIVDFIMFCMLLFQLLPLPNSYPISPDDAENMQSSKNRVSGLLDYEILKFSEILAVV